MNKGFLFAAISVAVMDGEEVLTFNSSPCGRPYAATVGAEETFYVLGEDAVWAVGASPSEAYDNASKVMWGLISTREERAEEYRMAQKEIPTDGTPTRIWFLAGDCLVLKFDGENKAVGLSEDRGHWLEVTIHTEGSSGERLARVKVEGYSPSDPMPITHLWGVFGTLRTARPRFVF